jgi:hypothetical protein
MKAITVEPKKSGSARLEDDIKVVIQFAAS